jgi:uncharacterized membrane protein YtjA (UPF0391 family)
MHRRPQSCGRSLAAGAPATIGGGEPERKCPPPVIEPIPNPRSLDAPMLKYAIIFLIISLVAGALGLTNMQIISRRISMALFAIFFLIAAVLFGMVVLIGEAVVR